MRYRKKTNTKKPLWKFKDYEITICYNTDNKPYIALVKRYGSENTVIAYWDEIEGVKQLCFIRNSITEKIAPELMECMWQKLWCFNQLLENNERLNKEFVNERQYL